MAVTLRGYARDGEGNPIAGASVEAFKAGEETPTATTLTDDAGAWEFENLPNAAYRVRVSYGDARRWVEYDNAVQFGMIVGPDGQTAPLPEESITTNHLKAYSVTASRIANGAVGTTQIADNAISTAKIQNNAISTAHIQDGAITTAKIADGAITPEKLSGSFGDVRVVVPSSALRASQPQVQVPGGVGEKLVWSWPTPSSAVGGVRVTIRARRASAPQPSTKNYVRIYSGKAFVHEIQVPNENWVEETIDFFVVPNTQIEVFADVWGTGNSIDVSGTLRYSFI